MKNFLIWCVLGLILLAPVFNLVWMSWDMWVNVKQSMTTNIVMQVFIMAAGVAYVWYVIKEVQDDEPL